MASSPGQMGQASTRNAKPVWILMKQEMMGWHQLDRIEGSVHKCSISRNPNFSGNEFLCFARFTS